MPDHPYRAEPDNADAVAHARRLVTLFDHPIKEERHRALSRLIAMGKPAVPALVEALHHEARFIRTGSLRALAQIASPDALEPLMAYLRTHSTEIGDNRAFAMQAIAAAIGPHVAEPEPLFNTLQEALRDRDDFVRAWAYVALGRLGDRRAIPLIEEGTRDRDFFVAEKATEALATLKAAPPAPTAWTDQLLGPEAIRFALQAPEQGRRSMAMKALLERVHTDADYNPFPMLRELLRGPTRAGRRSAVEALSHIQRPEAPHYLIDLVEESDDSDLVALALRALLVHGETLATMEPDRLVALLRRRLKDRDLLVRAAAVAALAQLQGELATELLVMACEDPESWVRDEASAALVEREERGRSGSELQPHIITLARSAKTLTARMAHANGPPGAEERADATVAERLLTLLRASVVQGLDTDRADAAAQAGFAALEAPTARLRVAGLELLHRLVEARHQLRPRNTLQVRALASALTSNDDTIVFKTLDVLEVALPRNSGAATARLTDLLYRGDKPLALRTIELLGRAGDIEAREALKALSRNDDLDVSASAIAALHEIGEAVP
ncbi:MAG: HEAT repeat domain-containing protein [Myxococcota bacterium]